MHVNKVLVLPPKNPHIVSVLPPKNPHIHLSYIANPILYIFLGLIDDKVTHSLPLQTKGGGVDSLDCCGAPPLTELWDPIIGEAHFFFLLT